MCLQGYSKETAEPDYERKGEIFKDLKSVLQEISPKFAENLASKVRCIDCMIILFWLNCNITLVHVTWFIHRSII